MSCHFDELDDVTKEHRLAGRKRPYQILVSRDRIERGDGPQKNVLLTPRSLRREKLGLRGFLDYDHGNNDEWDDDEGDGEGAGGTLRTPLGTSTLTPLGKTQRIRMAASNGVKTIFCPPEGETIEEEKKRWLSVRTRALSDYASGTAALELVDFKTVVATPGTSEPMFLFYIALRPISFIIPIYVELNGIAKSIGRCTRCVFACVCVVCVG